MTPEEKAKELIEKFRQLTNNGYELSPYAAKQCAAICVETILEAHFMKRDSGYKTFWIKVLQIIKTS